MIIQDVRWRVYQEMKKKRYRKPLSAAQRKRKVQRNIRLGLVLLLAMFVLTGVLKIIHPSLFSQKYYELDGDNIDACRPEMEVDLLTPNEYSRPGTKTEKITAIVIHYTANPGATARGNRDYFENLKILILRRRAATLLWAWTGRSFSVCRRGKWLMHPMTGIRTAYRLNAAIRMRAGNLQRRHIALWYSFLRGSVLNSILQRRILSATMM